MSQSWSDVKTASRVMNSGLEDESTRGWVSESSLLFTHNPLGDLHAAGRLIKVVMAGRLAPHRALQPPAKTTSTHPVPGVFAASASEI